MVIDGGVEHGDRTFIVERDPEDQHVAKAVRSAIDRAMRKGVESGALRSTPTGHLEITPSARRCFAIQ